MEQNKSIKLVGVIAVASLILTLVVTFRETKINVQISGPAQGSGVAFAGRAAGTESNYTSLFNQFDGAIQASSSLQVTGTLTTYGTTTDSTSGISTAPRSGSCATGTSTPISILNPFGATSTVKAIVTLTGTSTSAITYYMGTTTLPAVAPAYQTGVPAIFAGTALIASSSVAIGSIGTFLPHGISDLVSGSLGTGEILVGPNDRITLAATSTNAVGIPPGTDGLHNRTTWGCTYQILFRR